MMEDKSNDDVKNCTSECSSRSQKSPSCLRRKNRESCVTFRLQDPEYAAPLEDSGCWRGCKQSFAPWSTSAPPPFQPPPFGPLELGAHMGLYSPSTNSLPNTFDVNTIPYGLPAAVGPRESMSGSQYISSRPVRFSQLWSQGRHSNSSGYRSMSTEGRHLEAANRQPSGDPMDEFGTSYLPHKSRSHHQPRNPREFTSWSEPTTSRSTSQGRSPQSDKTPWQVKTLSQCTTTCNQPHWDKPQQSACLSACFHERPHLNPINEITSISQTPQAKSPEMDNFEAAISAAHNHIYQHEANIAERHPPNSPTFIREKNRMDLVRNMLTWVQNLLHPQATSGSQTSPAFQMSQSTSSCSQCQHLSSPTYGETGQSKQTGGSEVMLNTPGAQRVRFVDSTWVKSMESSEAETKNHWAARTSEDWSKMSAGVDTEPIDSKSCPSPQKEESGQPSRKGCHQEPTDSDMYNEFPGIKIQYGNLEHNSAVLEEAQKQVAMSTEAQEEPSPCNNILSQFGKVVSSKNAKKPKWDDPTSAPSSGTRTEQTVSPHIVTDELAKFEFLTGELQKLWAALEELKETRNSAGKPGTQMTDFEDDSSPADVKQSPFENKDTPESKSSEKGSGNPGKASEPALSSDDDEPLLTDLVRESLEAALADPNQEGVFFEAPVTSSRAIVAHLLDKLRQSVPGYYEKHSEEAIDESIDTTTMQSEPFKVESIFYGPSELHDDNNATVETLTTKLSQGLSILRDFHQDVTHISMNAEEILYILSYIHSEEIPEGYEIDGAEVTGDEKMETEPRRRDEEALESASHGPDSRRSYPLSPKSQDQAFLTPTASAVINKVLGDWINPQPLKAPTDPVDILLTNESIQFLNDVLRSSVSSAHDISSDIQTLMETLQQAYETAQENGAENSDTVFTIRVCNTLNHTQEESMPAISSPKDYEEPIHDPNPPPYSEVPEIFSTWKATGRALEAVEGSPMLSRLNLSNIADNSINVIASQATSPPESMDPMGKIMTEISTSSLTPVRNQTDTVFQFAMEPDTAMDGKTHSKAMYSPVFGKISQFGPEPDEEDTDTPGSESTPPSPDILASRASHMNISTPKPQPRQSQSPKPLPQEKQHPRVTKEQIATTLANLVKKPDSESTDSNNMHNLVQSLNKTTPACQTPFEPCQNCSEPQRTAELHFEEEMLEKASDLNQEAQFPMVSNDNVESGLVLPSFKKPQKLPDDESSQERTATGADEVEVVKSLVQPFEVDQNNSSEKEDSLSESPAFVPIPQAILTANMEDLFFKMSKNASALGLNKSASNLHMEDEESEDQGKPKIEPSLENLASKSQEAFSEVSEDLLGLEAPRQPLVEQSLDNIATKSLETFSGEYVKLEPRRKPLESLESMVYKEGTEESDATEDGVDVLENEPEPEIQYDLENTTPEMMAQQFDLKPEETTVESWAKENPEVLEPVDDNVLLVARAIFHHLKCLKSNTFSLPEAIVRNNDFSSIETNDFVKAVAPAMSMFNHSCCPNAAWDFIDGKVVCRVLRPIKSGEEITVTYGYNFNNYPEEERKQALKDSYCFTCKCEACRNHYKTTSDSYGKPLVLKCPECGESGGLQSSCVCEHCGSDVKVWIQALSESEAAYLNKYETASIDNIDELIPVLEQHVLNLDAMVPKDAVEYVLPLEMLRKCYLLQGYVHHRGDK